MNIKIIITITIISNNGYITIITQASFLRAENDTSEARVVDTTVQTSHKEGTLSGVCADWTLPLYSDTVYSDTVYSDTVYSDTVYSETV